MTGPDVTRATPAGHRGAAPVDTELEDLVGADVSDVEVEPVVRPLLRFTVAATMCVLGVTFIVVLLSWVLLLPVSWLFWTAIWSFGGTAECYPGC